MRFEHWTSGCEIPWILLGFDPEDPLLDDRIVMRDFPIMTTESHLETLTHRLILPRDANHHGTLYAGSMLSLALEAGYATAYRAVGPSANLVLKRVLDLRCFEPVSIGRVVEIRGLEVVRARAHIVVGLRGTPHPERSRPWMDSLMQFVQIDKSGYPEPLSTDPAEDRIPELSEHWSALRDRARKLLTIRA